MERDHDPEEKHLIFVIRATNIIETKMKEVIALFISAAPDRADFVESYLLNNAVIPFGAKAKLILAIANTLSVKINREALHVLLSRRNAFAHQDHLESIRLVTDRRGIPDVSYVVESFKASGELEAITYDRAFAEFVDAYSKVDTDLEMLHAKLKV